jgi:zinc D-Ala-D-Ala carboxypeptidase
MATPLSRYLTVEKFTKSETAKRLGISNALDPRHVKNAERTAAYFDHICDRLDKVLDFNSGYRSKIVNEAVPGSSKTSYHCKALAMDIDDDASPPHEQISDYDLAVAIAGMKDLPYDKVILEYGWVHVQFAEDGVKPRRETWTIKSKGAKALPGLVR